VRSARPCNRSRRSLALPRAPFPVLPLLVPFFPSSGCGGYWAADGHRLEPQAAGAVWRSQCVQTKGRQQAMQLLVGRLRGAAVRATGSAGQPAVHSILGVVSPPCACRNNSDTSIHSSHRDSEGGSC
jgi:hypothetical protein